MREILSEETGSMDNGNDDSRKKRDSTEVVKGDVLVNEEKAKKLRAAKTNKPSPSKEAIAEIPQLSSAQETSEAAEKTILPLPGTLAPSVART